VLKTLYCYPGGLLYAPSSIFGLREVIRPRIGEDDAIGAPRSEPPYYFLPMFQHSAAPVVDRDLFRPVAGKIRFPKRNHFSPVRNPRGVEVWCGYNQISVRVNRGQLRFRCLASMLFLGTCPVTPLFFYFHYDPNDCGSTQTTMNGQLVYFSSLRFSPEPQGPVIRAIPLNLPIQCTYNRFHYAYKVGYVPEVHDRTLLKSMNGKHIFRRTACNERWEQLSSEESYMLGEPMFFKAYAAFDPNTTPRHEVIHNFGCMVDSKRKGSQSQFFSRESNVLLFTVDAFLFPQITAKRLYLHCIMTVMKSTSKRSAKSCTYNRAVGRWEELYGPPSVCSCCDSVCEVSDFCKYTTQLMLDHLFSL
uniref:Zona pellucida glycoprotein 3d tandem duplicate 1 n=1 Tax=Hucho hucho TaxID=62062 RepID=A0A4W5L5E6_9TELE